MGQPVGNNPPRQPSPIDQPSADAVKVKVWVAPHHKPSALPKQSIAPTADCPPVRVNVLVSAKRRRSSPTSVQSAVEESPRWTEEWEDDRDPIRVLITPKPPLLQRGVVQGLLFTSFWTAMAALVASGGWLAIQLILNPGAVGWLTWVFPGWHVYPLAAGHTPRSLEVIRQGAAKVGLSLGEPLGLVADAAAVTPHSDLLIPVFAADSSCSSAIAPTSPLVPPCSHLVELRVYRPYPSAPEPLLQLIDRLAVTGPPESFVLAPLQSNATDSLGSARSLALGSVERIAGKSPTTSQVWFQLIGQGKQGNTQLAFGQVGYYDPTQARLYLLTQWTSPAGKAAVWQDAIAGGTTELVVDQTIGLEPGFKIHQLMGTSERQLQSVSLDQSALDNSTYQTAIAFAQSGLWSPALELMQRVKARAGWSATAEAQLALVSLHAQATRQQAERSWENPSQKILALLIDGRWAPALAELEAALKQGQDMSRLLQDASGQVWRRTQTALKVAPKQVEVQAWAMLLVGHRHDRAAAIAWLRQHLKQTGVAETAVANHNTLRRTLDILNTLPLAATHPPRLVGTVEEVSDPDLRQWETLTPTASNAGADSQRWYRVRLALFHDGRQWRRSPSQLALPSLDRGYHLWQLLGLTQAPQLQLVTWTADDQSRLLDATVVAVQYREGTIELLAQAGAIEPTALPALAVTPTAWRWVDNTSLSLAELHAQQPTLMAAIVPVLQEETTLPSPTITEVAEDTEAPDPVTALLPVIGDWTVQLVDVTGDQQPEAIVTLASPDGAAERTLIVSAQGQVIYGKDDSAAIVAIAELDPHTPPVLLIPQAQGYRFQQWSQERQQFE